MPDRTQDLTNHRKVAEACKNYTDKVAEEILYRVGEYDITTTPDNTTALVKTVPSNATRVKIKRIYGNSVKYAPSTPSDDTSVKDKSIPSNTYTLELNQIGGMSYKYNQLIQNSNFIDKSNWRIIGGGSDTTNLSASNNILTWTKSGSTTGIIQQGNFNKTNGHKYLCIASVNPSVLTAGSFLITGGNNDGGGYNGSIPANAWTTLTAIITATATGTGSFYVYGDYANAREDGFTCQYKNVICIDLTDKFGAGNEPSTVETAIPLLKADGYKLDGTDEYSSGEIRDTKTTSVVVSGNLCQTPTYNDVMNNTTAKTIDLGNLEKGTYTISFNLTENSGNRTFVIYYANNGVIDTNNPIYTTIYGTGSNKTYTFTLDGSVTYDDIRLGINSGSNNYTIKLDSLMLEKGSTALPYVPYQTPIQVNIPAEIQALDGYGITNNYIDFNSKKFNKTRRRKDLSTCNWTYRSDYGFWQTTDITDFKQPTNAYTIFDGECVPYKEDYWQNVVTNVNLNSIALSSNDNRIIVYNGSSTTTPSGILEYDLANPIETDISAYLPSGFNNIATNDNYTDLELANQFNADMPNKVSFIGTIKETLCTAIEQRRNGELIKTIELPYETSDGWSAGSVANVRDFTTNQRIPNVEKLNDLGSLNYTYGPIAGGSTYGMSATIIGLKYETNPANTPNLLCSPYDTINADSAYRHTTGISTLTTVPVITISEIPYNDVQAFKTAMSGKPLYYEKATVTPTSLDSIENIIEVEAGDTLTFVNSENQPVPSDITYRIEVAK